MSDFGTADSPAGAALTSDEKLWAAAAHASIILVMWGAFVPAVLWAWQGRKSAFIAFQSLQALAYQILQAVYLTLVTLVLAVGMVGLMVLVAFLSPDDVALIIAVEFVVLGLIAGAVLLYVVLGLAAAAACLAGRRFRYPLLGSWMARYLKIDPSREEVA